MGYSREMEEFVYEPGSFCEVFLLLTSEPFVFPDFIDADFKFSKANGGKVGVY